MSAERLRPSVREEILLLRIERTDHEELRVTRVHGTISAGVEATWHQLSTWFRAANGSYRQSAVVTLRADELDAVLTVLCREQS